MSDIQKTNDALALLGVKLSPMAELYADLHKAYMDLTEQHVRLFEAGAALALAAEDVFKNGDERGAITTLGQAIGKYQELLESWT